MKLFQGLYLIRIFKFLFILLILLSCESKQTHQAETEPISHEFWDQVLMEYVDASGRVNYQGLKEDPEILLNYLDLLRFNRPNEVRWNKKERLAYWINMYNALMIGEIVLQQNEISRQERSTVVDNRTRLRELLNQARSLGIHTSSFDDIVHSRGPPVSLEGLTSQIQDRQIENNVNLLHQQLHEARQLGLDMPSYDEIVHQSGRGDGYTPQRITQELQEARSLPSNEAPRPTPQPEG